MNQYWPLLGVAVVVAGFALKRNAVLVVVIAAVVTALVARKSIGELLELLGTSFVKDRILLLYLLPLPVIGVLEHAGLRERAAAWILGFKRLTLSRLLIVYLFLREIFGMFGLTSIAGQPQTVRPLLAPMAEATATRSLGALDETERHRVRALAAATDNVGLFFGEDVFIAFGAVILIKSFFEGQGIVLEPLSISLWALPTAIAAFLIHAGRITVFERRLRQRLPRASVVPPKHSEEH
jgi:uncharacterized membrane protein